jgi:hypothetical protein
LTSRVFESGKRRIRKNHTFPNLKLPKLAYVNVTYWIIIIKRAFKLHFSTKTCNGTAHFKKCKQLFEYQYLLLRDIWWLKF